MFGILKIKASHLTERFLKTFYFLRLQMKCHRIDFFPKRVERSEQKKNDVNKNHFRVLTWASLALAQLDAFFQKSDRFRFDDSAPEITRLVFEFSKKSKPSIS